MLPMGEGVELVVGCAGVQQATAKAGMMGLTGTVTLQRRWVLQWGIGTAVGDSWATRVRRHGGGTGAARGRIEASDCDAGGAG